MWGLVVLYVEVFLMMFVVPMESHLGLMNGYDMVYSGGLFDS